LQPDVLMQTLRVPASARLLMSCSVGDTYEAPAQAATPAGTHDVAYRGEKKIN
jgi:hypothetical protein